MGAEVSDNMDVRAIPWSKHEAYTALLYTSGHTFWSDVHCHAKSLPKEGKYFIRTTRAR